MEQWADYSWSRPTKEQLAPYTGVLRYLEGGGSRPDLTADEVKTLHSWGKRISLIWQRGTTDATGDANKGAEIARLANAEADKLGAPQSVPIYYAVDSDLAPQIVAPYFSGIRSVAGRPVGIYGSYALMAWAYESGILYRWQARGWDYGKGVSPFAHLHQATINLTIAPGVVIDKNDVYVPTTRTWDPYVAPAPTPTPTPAPAPAPAPTPTTGTTMVRCETVVYRKRLICKHSLHKHEAVAAGSGSGFYYNLIQGSYTTSNTLSKGTHGGGGVTDDELDGVTWAKAYSVNSLKRSKMLLGLIRWWSGNHHDHVIDPECPNLSPEAIAQVIEVGKGGDGLVGTIADNGNRTYVAKMVALFNQRRSTPARVRLIQRGLGLGVDGIWGPVTDAAISKVRATKIGVRAVQTGLLVDADGAWGPVTEKAYAALRSVAYRATVAPAPAPAPAVIDKTLPYGPFPYPNGAGSVYGPSTAGKNWWSGKVGSKTVSVTSIRLNIKRIQKAARVTQDGIYGPVTARAVAAWQKSHRLVVDGLVGPQTWNSM